MGRRVCGGCGVSEVNSGLRSTRNERLDVEIAAVDDCADLRRARGNEELPGVQPHRFGSLTVAARIAIAGSPPPPPAARPRAPGSAPAGLAAFRSSPWRMCQAVHGPARQFCHHHGHEQCGCDRGCVASSRSGCGPHCGQPVRVFVRGWRIGHPTVVASSDPTQRRF